MVRQVSFAAGRPRDTTRGSRTLSPERLRLRVHLHRVVDWRHGLAQPALDHGVERTSRPALMTSGPMPSAGMEAMRWVRMVRGSGLGRVGEW